MGGSLRPEAAPDDTKIPPADLWDLKVSQGMAPDQATQYVAKIHGAPPGFAGHGSTGTWGDAPAAPRSGLYNALNTFGQGASLGFGDEINAALYGAKDALTGQDTFSRSYDRNVAVDRAGLRQFANDHPVAAPALQLAGGVTSAMAAAPFMGASLAGGLSTGQKVLKGAAIGADLGAINGFGSSDGDLSSRLRGAAYGSAIGAAGGMAAVPASAVIAQAAERLGRMAGPAMAKLGDAVPMTRALPPVAAAVSDATGETTPPDRATQLLIQRLGRAGLSPTDALNRVGGVSDAKPLTVMELAGDMSDPVRQLGKLVARTPSAGAAQIKAAIADRSNALPTATRVLGDAGDALGVARTNLEDHAGALSDQRLAKASPLYEQAFQSGPVPLDAATSDGVSLSALLERPSVKSAIKFHNDLAAERGEAPLALPGAPQSPVPGPVQSQSIRDASGRLRSDLSGVSDQDLDAEWQRLAELNAKEEAMHGGVQDSGYRGDYDALPSMEKTGRTTRTVDAFGNRINRQAEDLPDADGAVDAERLAADNKVVSDYNRSTVVRAARQRAMDRIQAETGNRPQPWEDTSFDYGANSSTTAGAVGIPPIPDYLKGKFSLGQWADLMQKQGVGAGGVSAAAPGPQSVPLKTLQQIKFKLDDALGFAKRSGQLPDGSAATNAKLGAINDTRKSLLDIVNAHSPLYGAANATWAGESALQNASDAGRDFLTMPIDELTNTYKGMTAGEQEQFKIAALSGPVRDRIFKSSAVDLAKTISQTPDMQERLGVLVNDPRELRGFMDNLRQERAIAATNQAIPNGSDTFANFANDADASAANGRGVLTALLRSGPKRAASTLFNNVLESQASRALQGVNEQTANALAPKLTAGMSNREDLVKMLEELVRSQQGRPVLPRLNPQIGGAVGGSFGQLGGQRDY